MNIESIVEFEWFNFGVHKTLNIGDTLSLFAMEFCRYGSMELSTSKFSSGKGLASWKSFPPHLRWNGEYLLIRMADIPRA